MKQEMITEVMQQMLPYLDNAQLKQLRQVMEQTLYHYDVSVTKDKPQEDDSNNLISMFIAAKRIEGCSEKTLKYYKTTIDAMVSSLCKNVRHILTEDLRTYLTKYQSRNQSSRVTIDNIRRILSSFFSWLEDEDYIIKSPVRRIHKVKTASNIKETPVSKFLKRKSAYRAKEANANRFFEDMRSVSKAVKNNSCQIVIPITKRDCCGLLRDKAEKVLS